MATSKLDVLTGEVANAMVKGTVSKAEIMSLTVGVATDYMTEEQVIARKVSPKMEFVAMVLREVESGMEFEKTFRYYQGAIPANSVQGRLQSTYNNLSEGDTVNVITKEAGKPDNTFIVWDIITV